jgi:AcrR family transcriptional regulator
MTRENIAPSPASSPTEIVDPRWRRTRQAILDAGAGVSIDDIVRSADVSKQSFYNHFADKDALAHELLRLARNEIDTLVTAANEGVDDPARRVVTGLAVYVAQALCKPHQGQLIGRLLAYDTPLDAETNSPVIADISAGLAQGRLAVFTPETGVGFLLGAGEALIRQVVASRDRDAAATACQQYSTLVLRAFGLSPLEAEMISAEAANRIVRNS